MFEQSLSMSAKAFSGRTVRRWRQNGQLKPRGYWRPDGHRGTAHRTDDDIPVGDA
jgi:hypothetical protein